MIGGRDVVSILRLNAPPPGFPAPLLTLSEPSVSEGQMVTVTCTAVAQALVTLEGVPAAVPGQPAQLQLNATENDDRRNFFCDATLDVDGETLIKNRSAELRVLCELVITPRPTPPDNFQGPACSRPCRGGGAISHGPRLSLCNPTPCPQTPPGWTIRTAPGAGRGPRAQSRRCAARPAGTQNPQCTVRAPTAGPCWLWAC